VWTTLCVLAADVAMLSTNLILFSHTHTHIHPLTGAHSHTRRSSQIHLTVCRT